MDLLRSYGKKSVERLFNKRRASNHVAANQSSSDYLAVQIDSPRGVLSSLTQKLDRVLPSLMGEECCIFKVPVKFRKIQANAYTPQIVSIGPFHHGKTGLVDMEDHKLRYMKMLLDRTDKYKFKLKECVDSIKRCEEGARKCYSEPISLDSGKFVEMMVVDGLFIIELFGKVAGVFKIERDDVMFNNFWSMPILVRDLILLENQIPMFVIQLLFEIVKEQNIPAGERSLGEYSLNELALRFFDPLMKREEKDIKRYFKKKGAKHFLDLLSKTYRNLSEGKSKEHSFKPMPCVTELWRAGVKFKMDSNAKSFLDIKFADGVMTIPPILIKDETDTLLRNLIAFEQCRNRKFTYISSYALLMGSLIETRDDVACLRECQIITNCLGNDGDVADLFNKLWSEVIVVNLCYSKLYKDVNNYYDDRQHFWESTQRCDDFHNPWAIISFIGAILLKYSNIVFILTLIATIFAVLSFVVHGS